MNRNTAIDTKRRREERKHCCVDVLHDSFISIITTTCSISCVHAYCHRIGFAINISLVARTACGHIIFYDMFRRLVINIFSEF